MSDASTEPAQKKVKVDSPVVLPNKLQWASIFTANTKESGEFFAALLGWKADTKEYSEHWLEIKGPNEAGTNIALHKTEAKEGAEKPGEIGLTFLVKDLAKVHEHIKGVAGVKIVKAPAKEPWGGFQAVYKSPEGTQIDVLEEDPEMMAKDKETKGTTEAKEEKQETITKPSNGNGAGLCHVEIPCGDMDRCAKFFTDTFGWSFTKWGSESFFQTNDDEYAKLGGSLLLTEERIKIPVVYINVKNVEQALEKVKANGGTVTKEKFALHPEFPDKLSAKITDCEGNAWSIYCDETKQKNLK